MPVTRATASPALPCRRNNGRNGAPFRRAAGLSAPMTKLQAIRGMRDVLPPATPRWQYLEQAIKAILRQYGYREIRLPLVEKTALFARSIGADSDIVGKEMYTFNDRNGDSLSLRPEGTAGCVRAGIEHGLFHNQTQRLWYSGPMFRHERPQKGRQRQFSQIGVEAFGFAGPDIDAELILLCARLWRALKPGPLRLEINSLGMAGSRGDYRRALAEYFSARRARLDADSLVRLEQNPLRILDSKNPALRSLIDEAPAMADYLCAESTRHFAGLRRILDGAGVQYRVNPRLVRGLDYYGKTVFEWITDRLGAQGAVCAGGRYDDLVGQHGARPTPAVGFALGLERLIELCDFSAMPDQETPHVYLMLYGEAALWRGLALSEELRRRLPAIRILSHCGGGNLKSQFKKADKSGARLALILAGDELEKDRITVKYLRETRPQEVVALPELADFLATRLGPG